MCEEVEERDEMELAAVVRSDGRPPLTVVVLQVSIEVERVFGGRARGVGSGRQGSRGERSSGRQERAHMRWGCGVRGRQWPMWG